MIRLHAMFLFALILLLPAMYAIAQDSTLTYQGQLRDTGQPVTGTVNLEFRLFDQLSGGSEVASPQSRPNWPVEDGLFQVDLNFGSSAFDGSPRFLDVRVNGTPLIPRQRVSATPYALLAGGLVGGVPETGWSLTGNAGTGPANFLGTTDNQPLVFRVGGERALQLDGGESPNILAGSFVNFISTGVGGATVSGGGSFGGCTASGCPNSVSGNFGTVGGGEFNRAGAAATVGGGRSNSASGEGSTVSGGLFNVSSGSFSAIGGGQANIAAGDYSFVVGRRAGNADAAHDGVMMFADSQNADFNSTGPNQFLVRASGGAAINTNAPRAPLTVQGADNWNPTSGNGFGDFHVGTSTLGLAVGVALTGGGAGAVRLWASGGNRQIVFPTSTNATTLSLQPDGLVGVGRLAATNRLEVEGNASKTTSGSWLANSDARIKTDVQDIDSPLQRLMQIRPVRFRYTEDYRHEHPQVGESVYYNVIAQEFAEVFPEAVKGSGETLPGRQKSAENEILQVDVHPALITSIAAVQELALRLEQIEAENESLRREMVRERDEMEARLALLEKLLSARKLAADAE